MASKFNPAELRSYRSGSNAENQKTNSSTGLKARASRLPEDLKRIWESDVTQTAGANSGPIWAGEEQLFLIRYLPWYILGTFGHWNSQISSVFMGQEEAVLQMKQLFQLHLSERIFHCDYPGSTAQNLPHALVYGTLRRWADLQAVCSRKHRNCFSPVQRGGRAETVPYSIPSDLPEAEQYSHKAGSTSKNVQGSL